MRCTINCQRPVGSPLESMGKIISSRCPATASKTYIGSVLFRTLVYTGAKQASMVPTGSKQDSSPHNDDVKDVSVLHESELIGPV